MGLPHILRTEEHDASSLRTSTGRHLPHCVEGIGIPFRDTEGREGSLCVGAEALGRHLLPSEATIPPRRSLAIEPYPPFDPRFAPVSQAGGVDSDDRISDGLQERVGVTRCGR